MDEFKYILNEIEKTQLNDASATGESIFLLGNPNEYVDINDTKINPFLTWDFIKKHPNVEIKKISNVLDRGFDVIDQHVPYIYLLAEYDNHQYPYIVALKYNAWMDDEKEYFQISLVCSMKEAIEVLERESCHYYSDNFNSPIEWKEIREKLLVYEESKFLNNKINSMGELGNKIIKNKL